MKIVSILNQKGGCGKTTTAVNLSHALSKKGFKTLLLDLDPQAHSTFALGITHVLGTSDLLENYLSASSSSLDQFITQRDDNFFVVTSSLGLSAMEQKLSDRSDRLLILYKLLSLYSSFYDYCIIDCPPNLGLLTLNAYFASNYIIVPITTCDLSLRGVDTFHQIRDMIHESSPNSPKIFYLFTQYDKRFRYSFDFLERLRIKLRENLMQTIIRTNINLRESFSQGQTIFEYKPQARGAQDYMALANEIAGKTDSIKWARFTVKGKDYTNAYVVGDFNKWEKSETHKLKKIDSNTWGLSIPLPTGKYHYKFFVDNRWQKDPFNNLQEDDAYGGKNSVIHVV
jgi:chromosome partitioning protein